MTERKIEEERKEEKETAPCYLIKKARREEKDSLMFFTSVGL